MAKRGRGNHRRPQPKNVPAAPGMRRLVFTDLNENTEQYVREGISKLAAGKEQYIQDIKVEDQRVIVVFKDSKYANAAFNQIKGRQQKGGRPWNVELVDVQAASAAPADCGTVQAAPYHFVSVMARHALLDSPVYHDRLDLQMHYTGALHCTLTAHTPLLAANDQYSLGPPHSGDIPGPFASARLREAVEQLIQARVDAQEHVKPDQKIGGGVPEGIKPDKKILEPLALPGHGSQQPGPVLIPGTQLKGMLRQSLAALLAAPMERVWERTFSYRPNLQIVTKSEDGPLVEACAALVVAGGGRAADGSHNPVTVALFKLTDVCYVHPEAEPRLPERIRKLLDESPEKRARRYDTPKNRRQLHIKSDEFEKFRTGMRLSAGNILRLAGPNARIKKSLEGYLPVVYFNGIDLAAQLNRKFHEKNPELAGQLRTKSPGGYRLVLLPKERPGESLVLSHEDLAPFFATLEHLADFQHGQLRDHPLIDNADQREQIQNRLNTLRQRGLLPGDLIFLEKPRQQGHPPARTLGHHYYYRFRYRDSIHQTANPADQAGHVSAGNPAPGAPSTLRDMLAPRPLEMACDERGGPRGLSAARLLFGYVGSSRGKYAPAEPLSFGIGRPAENPERPADFSQLAGRITINHALEQVTDVTRLEERFLNAMHQCLVPLRPLGAPKPSAVEHYLTQDRLGKRRDNGILCTFGDTPDDASAGNLRGRKFYLHQPQAATNPECYELLHENQPDWKSGNTVHLLGNQAAIARFVSKPGTRFRFTLRFKNLRDWELGAVLFVLEPTLQRLRRLISHLPEPLRPKLEHWCSQVEKQSSTHTPALAHKLGHGRPLGLGSVTAIIDQAVRLTTAGQPLQALPQPEPLDVEPAVDAFFARFIESLGKGVTDWFEHVLLPWLELHRYAGRTRYDYPRKDQTIFAYHQKLRVQHAKGRKCSGRGRPSPVGLPPVDKIE